MVRHVLRRASPSIHAVIAVLCGLLIAGAIDLAAQAAPCVVVGRVTDEQGAPLSGATIVATDDAGATVAARTDEGGGFRLTLPAGSHRFMVSRGTAARQVPMLALTPGETLRIDVALGRVETGRAAHVVRRLPGGPTFVLDRGPLADLPLDRDDASAAILALAPGVARGSAFGAAAGVGTPRRLDGLDLTDPFDGRAAGSPVLPAAAMAMVRSGVGADERDGSGAVLDVVTRAGGDRLRGLFDVAGGGRAWTRDALPEELLAANPRLADRDRVGRSLRAAGVISGPLTARLGFGLAVEHADDARADSTGAVTRTPRAHGRILWSAGPRSANVVGFVERRATDGDVPFAVRPFAAEGLANARTSRTLATRATWHGPLGEALRVTASVEVLHAARRVRPTSDRAARQDDVTGAIGDSLGLVHDGHRTRAIAGGALDWRTSRLGGHDLRVGIDVERARVADTASFTTGEFFHDLAGRPDSVDVWSGTDRRTALGREALWLTDTWAPGRLAVVGGLRVAHLSGGAYGTTSVQPRVSATVALDDGARVVARGSAGIVADPLLASHVDRTVAGETPIVTYQILRDGRRLEVGRTTPVIAGVADGIRHPQVRELTAGADVRLSRAVQIGGTVVARRFLDAIDTVQPDARWLALPRLGLDGRPLAIYRWVNRRPGDAPSIANVDGVAYLGADGQPVGVAAAGRDYIGLIGHARVALPGDRGAITVAVTSARNRGTIDDTTAAGIGRSDRFASPTAALTNVDGIASLTPDLAITVFGTTRVPWLPIRLSAIYQRLSGVHYTPSRTFAAGTLDVPFAADGRTVLLEPRGSRELTPVDDLTLRIASPLPLGRRRAVEIYADVYNALGRQTVTAVETGAPIGVSSGAPLPLGAPTEVQRPFRVVAGGRWSF